MGAKVAVAGKGGVGKTTIVGSLARTWAREGRKVTVVALALYEGLLTVVPVIPEKPPGIN